MTTELELTARKVAAMAQWSDVLIRSARDVLNRMDATMTSTEVKIAMVREMIARRDRELGLTNETVNGRE